MYDMPVGHEMSHFWHGVGVITGNVMFHCSQLAESRRLKVLSIMSIEANVHHNTVTFRALPGNSSREST